MGRLAVPALLRLVVVSWFLLVPTGQAGAGTIAMFPARNAAGDSAAVLVLAETLSFELGRYGDLLGPEGTRNALRRLRIRDGDQAAPPLLRLLGEELAADWFASATLHDAERRAVPRLAVSLRLYSAASGELVWSGFRGASGSDRRKLLGLGKITDLESLIPFVVRDLLAEMPPRLESLGAEPTFDRAAAPSGLGKVAIFPLTGSTGQRATLHAETVTEALRAQLFGSGVDLASPNLVSEIMRQQQRGVREGVAAATRTALHEMAGANKILTGEMETYDLGGSEFEPRPEVAVALRLLDAASGRILWTGALERTGWDGQGLFTLGRIYSRGALAERLMEILTERLFREYQATDRTDQR